LPARLNLDEIGQIVCGAPWPELVAKKDMQGRPEVFVLRQGHDRGDALVLLDGQEIDEGLATRLRGRERQRQTFSL